MYKTVRHGENSLQYTILPQTEEVLNNSGLKGKGRDYSPSIHVRRSRRRSTVKYVLLIVFGIIIALALASVPLYVMNGALYARRNHQDSHEVITSAPLAPTGREIVKLRLKDIKVAPMMMTTSESKLGISTTTESTSTTTASSTSAPVERTTTQLWPMPTLKPWKRVSSSMTIPPLPTEDDDISQTSAPPANDQHYYQNLPKEDTIIRPTVTPEPINIRKVFRLSKTPETVTKVKAFEDVLITTKAPSIRTTTTRASSTTASEHISFKDLKDTLLSVDDDDEFKESLEVDEVFSLPPLKPESSSESDTDEVTVSKARDGWYGARWPFVDTSSYFQWTGYSPGDNLLLPLLVAALSSIALVLLLALAVRRRKRSHGGASAQIGKLTADLQADDNTNLLTAENPEEGEE